MIGMKTTQQLAVPEHDDVAAHRPIVEVAPTTSRSRHPEPAPAPSRTQNRPLAFLRRTVDAICQAGQPAATPQAPLISPNGAVTWTPFATNSLRRTSSPDPGPH